MKLIVRLEKREGTYQECIDEGIKTAKDFRESIRRIEDRLLTEKYFKREEIPVSNHTWHPGHEECLTSS